MEGNDIAAYCFTVYRHGLYALFNVIRIENGAVYMEEANCRDQLCVHQGKIRNRAKNIVCLPHNLVVSLETGQTGGEQDDLDVIIY